MARAALLSIHARVAGAEPSTWEDPSLVQTWGPRHNVYTVPAADLAIFTVGIHPEDEKGRRRAEGRAAQVRAVVGTRRMDHSEVGRALGVHPNSLLYAATTGTVLIRWDGARRPVIWTAPPPASDPRAARQELARRYLHVFGPTTAASFGSWSGLGEAAAVAVFEALRADLMAVRTPIGEAWLLRTDEEAARAAPGVAAPARLLPSGDSFLLFWGPDRELVLPQLDRRQALWPPRVWPGGLLVDGELAGTWRRAGPLVTVQTWARLAAAQRQAVETEAALLPLAGLGGRIDVRWESAG